MGITPGWTYPRWNLVSGNVIGIVDPSGNTLPLLAGSIIIAAATTDGAGDTPQDIPSQTVTGTMAGEKVLFSTVVRDDFGGMAASIITNPGHIYVPAGVRYARFTSSISFPAEAASGANGVRWSRMIALTATHQGNSGIRPAIADLPVLTPINGLLIPVTAASYFWVSAIQNCGSALTLGSGNAGNNWASNWFMAEFYK